MGFKARNDKDPFSMMERSHRRLEEQLDALLDATAALRADASSTSARAALDEVVEFIDRSVARHERDEELSLFPRLSGRADLEELVAMLASEHETHRPLHEELGMIVQAVRERPATEDEVHRLHQLANDLLHAYSDHIDREENRLFPAAREVLAQAELEAMADEMQARRGR